MKTNRRTHFLSALLTLVLALALAPALSQLARAVTPETWTGSAVTAEKVYYMDPYDPTKLIYDYKYFTTMTEAWNWACAGYPIKLTSDWLLYDMTNNTLDICLEVPEGKTVTLDLNGHTIDRGLTASQYRDGGSIFEVRKNATLNLIGNGGKLRGGSAYKGSAIYAYGTALRLNNVTIEDCYGYSEGTIYSAGSTVELNGVTIQNCVANGASAVAVNNSTLYMKDCTVQNCTLADTSRAAVISLFRYQSNRPSATLINTHLIGDPNTNAGSGIELVDADLTMTGGSIRGFRANSDSGGAIYTNTEYYDMEKYQITLTDVDISDCSAPKGGGAIAVDNRYTFQMTGGSIQNCTADGGSGGAIYGYYANSNYGDGLTLTNVKISNCSAYDYGGAISLEYNGLNMTGGSITDCRAKGNYGGAIYAYYANSDYGTDGVWLKDVDIAYCQSAKYGGGIYAMATDLRLDDCDIAGCQSQYGGGIYAEDCNSSSNKSLDLNRTDIHGCQATYHGGGIYADHSILSLDSCAIDNNTAQYGGGIYTANSAAETVDIFTQDPEKYASISGNYASLDGGGLYSNGGNCAVRIGTKVEYNTAGNNGGGVFINYHDLTVKNGNSNYAGTRISNNRAAGSGGGIYFNGSNLYLEDDTAITGNRADSGNGGGVYMNVNSALALGDTLEVSGNRCGGENGGGIYAGYAPVTLSGAPHITGNLANGNADDLCMDGELTVGDIVCDQTGMNLMKNARVGLSSVTNRDFRLGLAATTTPFYCTDPDMDLMEDLVERPQVGHETVQYDHVGVISAGAPSGNKYYSLNWGFDSFEIEGQTYCDIDRKAATIHVTMPEGTDLTNLTALIDGKTVEEWNNAHSGKSDLTMVQAGDFSRPIACMMKRSSSSNFPYIWYITVDCAPVNYAAYTFPVSYNNKGELIQSSQRHYYDTFEKAWETANRMNCGVGLEKDLQLSAPLTVTGKVVLDLNGRTIDRGLTAETENGYAFQVNTTFTVQDTSAARTGTVTGCNNGNYIEGGVFRMKDGVTLKLVGGNYTGNFGHYGSVVYLEQNSHLRVNGTTFADNKGWFGGVISMGLRSQADIWDATFRNNEARYNGGAISLFRADTSLVVGTSTFTGNKAGEAGGAIYCLGSYDTLYLEDVTITGNHAGTQGGGIILDDGSTGSTFNGVTVKDNTCGAARETQNPASNLYLTGGSKIGQLYHRGTIDNDIYVGTDDITKPVAYCVCYPNYLSGLHTSESGWYFNYKAVYNNYDAYVTQEEACAKILGVVMKSMPDGDNTVESLIPQIGDAVIDHQARTITVTLPYNANLKRVILKDIALPSDGSSYSPNPTWGSLMDLRTPQMIEVEKVGMCLSIYTITAQLQAAPEHTVTVTGGTGGGSYAEGSTVTITANAPTEGNTFDKWTTTGDGVTFADANASTTTFTMPAHDVTVTATYKAVLTDITNVAITAEAPVAGQTLATPTTATANVTVQSHSWQGTEGAPVNNTATCSSTYLLMVTLKAAEGYQFPVNAAVTFDGNAANRVYKNEDGTLTAYYTFPKTGKDTLETVAWPSDMTIRQGETLSLPDRVAITTTFRTASAAEVTWSPEPAAQTAAGVYPYTGALALPDTIDPNGMATTTVTVTVKAPETVGKITITPETNPDGTVSVTLSCDTPDATIRYTVDGARPTGSDPVYSAPIVLGEALRENGGTEVYVLRVTAEKEGMTTRYDFRTIEVTVPKPTNTVTITGGTVVNRTETAGSGDARTYTLEVGGTVAIQAAVPADKVFKNWSGTYFSSVAGAALDLTLRDPNAVTTTFTMPRGPVTVTANFVDKLDRAALTMDEPTSGETLTLPDTASYGETAYPVSWTTAESGDNVLCTASVTVPADLTKGIVFADNAAATINGESVSAAVDANGSITVTRTYTLAKPTGPLYSITRYSTAITGPGELVGSYPAGSTVTLTAPAVEGYRFYQWQTADETGESAITVAGLTGSKNATVSFTMPAENIMVIAAYRPLVKEIAITIPAPEAGQPFAEYPDEVTLIFEEGNRIPVDETVRTIFWGTEHTTAVFGTQYLAIARVTEEDIYPSAFADNLTVKINGVDATNAVDVVTYPDEISYYDLSGGMLNVSYAFVDPTPATLTGLPTLEPIHNVTPGTAYSALGLPTSVEVETSGGVMVVPVVWQNVDGTTPTGQSFVDVSGTLTYPDGLRDPNHLGNSIPLRIYLDGGIDVPDTVAAPTAVPLGAGGTEYMNRVEVTLYCATPDATIYYTLNGGTPDSNSTRYDGAAIVLETTTTIKAVAVKDGMTDSAVAEFTYTVVKTYPAYYSYEGTRYLVGHYKEGDSVTVTAENLPGKTFLGWTAAGITLAEGQTTAKSVTFTMPANEVVFTPQYENESILTALTFTVPPLIAGQPLPDKVSLVAETPTMGTVGEGYDWLIPVTWSEGDPAVVSGTTYHATITFADDMMGISKFTGMPKVVVQNRGKDGSLTENNTVSSILNNERSITVTFTCGETKSKLLRVNLPDLGGVPNGTSLEDIKAQLGSTLTLVTDSGNSTVDVTWNDAIEGSYDPTSRAEQSFTLTGSFAMPENIDANGFDNTVTVPVTVSARGFAGAPIASVAEGAYTTPQTVTLSSMTPGATIYYTTDGTEPTDQSMVCAGPITLRTNTTLKAVAMKEGMSPSIVSTYVYSFYTPSSGSGGGTSTAAGTVPLSNGDLSYQMPVTTSGRSVTMKTVDQGKLDGFFAGMDRLDALTIDFTALKKNVTSVSIPTQILSAVSQALEEKGTDGAGMTILLPKGSTVFDAAAAKSMAGQTSGKIQLTITDAALSAAQKTALKDMTTFGGVTVALTSNGKTISAFDGGTVLLKVPFTVPAGQEAQGFSLWYVPENGAPEKLRTAYRDGCLEARVSHFSEYVIAYDEADAAGYADCSKDAVCPLSAFSDLSPTAWYHDGVHYCLVGGLMGGYGNGIFAPGDTFNRAMMVQVLYNMEEPPTLDGQAQEAPFTDVADGQWYTNAVYWASINGITAGYGKNFGPADPITREQVAQFLYNFARFKGYDLTARADLSAFADGGSTSGWAQTAMQWTVGSGILSGKGNGVLDPTATATRAEVATMLMNFCERVAK